MSATLSRRNFLKGASASAGLLALAACTAPSAAPSGAAEAPAAAAPAGPVVNSLGITLPDDAAPLDKQTVILQSYNNIAISADWFKVNYRQLPGTTIGGDSLTVLDKNLDLLPGSAESWEVMDDLVTWHFKIRQGQQWSDGKPLTAHDWVNSFRYGADPETGFDFAWYFFFMKNWTPVNSGELPLEELGCRALDDYTLEIVTEYPAPYVPGWLAIAVPHPKHVFDVHGEAWSLQPET
jgi:ABC-type transport system substrate-binding protein